MSFMTLFIPRRKPTKPFPKGWSRISRKALPSFSLTILYCCNLSSQQRTKLNNNKQSTSLINYIFMSIHDDLLIIFLLQKGVYILVMYCSCINIISDQGVCLQCMIKEIYKSEKALYNCRKR